MGNIRNLFLRVAVMFSVVLLSISPVLADTGGIVDGYAKISDTFTIHYQTAGSGEIAIIFIPGWTMTTRAFEHQLSQFANSKKFKAVTYDPRSQGLTTHTTEGHYYEQHGRDLHTLIEKLELNKIILAGWSAGGGDELAYVNQFGAEKLVALILLDTCPKVKGHDYTKEWVWFGTKDEGDQDGFLKFWSYDTMIDRQMVNLEFAKWMLEDVTPQNTQFVNEMTNQTGDAVAALLNTSYWYTDYSKDLIALNGKIPLLYFLRDEEPWVSLAKKWAATNTPDAKIVALGKHMMFWERHKEFNDILDQWLLENVK